MPDPTAPEPELTDPGIDLLAAEMASLPWADVVEERREQYRERARRLLGRIDHTRATTPGDGRGRELAHEIDARADEADPVANVGASTLRRWSSNVRALASAAATHEKHCLAILGLLGMETGDVVGAVRRALAAPAETETEAGDAHLTSDAWKLPEKPFSAARLRRELDAARATALTEERGRKLGSVPELWRVEVSGTDDAQQREIVVEVGTAEPGGGHRREPLETFLFRLAGQAPRVDTEGGDEGERRRTVDTCDPDGSEDSWSDTPVDLVESAFGLICNVDGPAQGWTQNDEWVRAADRWCARYDRVTAAPTLRRELHDHLVEVITQWAQEWWQPLENVQTMAADLAPRLAAALREVQERLAAPVQTENGPTTWRRLLAEHGPCGCPTGESDDGACPRSCALCRDLPDGWPCPALGGYGPGALIAASLAPNEGADSAEVAYVAAVERARLDGPFEVVWRAVATSMALGEHPSKVASAALSAIWEANETVSGADLIRRERMRQITGEGWTPEHDATHPAGALVDAAAAYVLGDPGFWPFDGSPKLSKNDRTRELVKAGALIAAEIDRLDRTAPAGPPAAAECPWHGSKCDGTDHEDHDPAMPLGERLAATRPGAGVRIGLDLYGVAGVLDEHADVEAEQARAAHLRYLARAARSHADGGAGGNEPLTPHEHAQLGEAVQVVNDLRSRLGAEMSESEEWALGLLTYQAGVTSASAPSEGIPGRRTSDGAPLDVWFSPSLRAQSATPDLAEGLIFADVMGWSVHVFGEGWFSLRELPADAVRLVPAPAQVEGVDRG